MCVCVCVCVCDRVCDDVFTHLGGSVSLRDSRFSESKHMLIFCCLVYMRGGPDEYCGRVALQKKAVKFAAEVLRFRQMPDVGRCFFFILFQSCPIFAVLDTRVIS